MGDKMLPLKNVRVIWEWGIMSAGVIGAGNVVCYHIRRNHCAYLFHRKTTLSKSLL